MGVGTVLWGTGIDRFQSRDDREMIRAEHIMPHLIRQKNGDILLSKLQDSKKVLCRNPMFQFESRISIEHAERVLTHSGRGA